MLMMWSNLCLLISCVLVPFGVSRVVSNIKKDEDYVLHKVLFSNKFSTIGVGFLFISLLLSMINTILKLMV